MIINKKEVDLTESLGQPQTELQATDDEWAFSFK